MAEAMGFSDAEKLADEIFALKEQLHLRTNLYDLELKEEQIAELVQLSKHPNLRNNPVEITDKILREMYEKFAWE